MKLLYALLISIALCSAAHAADRWLVYVPAKGRIPERTSQMWCGVKPEPGKNVPVDSIVLMMPKEPVGASPLDFVRKSNAAVYQPENNAPPARTEPDERKQRRERLKDNSKLTDKEFIELLRKERAEE